MSRGEAGDAAQVWVNIGVRHRSSIHPGLVLIGDPPGSARPRAEKWLTTTIFGLDRWSLLAVAISNPSARVRSLHDG